MFVACVGALSFPGRTDAHPVSTKVKATIIRKHLVILGTHVKTTRQSCDNHFCVAVGYFPSWPSVAGGSCSKSSKSIVSQDLRSRIELFNSTNGHHKRAAVRVAYSRPCEFRTLSFVSSPVQIRNDLRFLAIWPEAGKALPIYKFLHTIHHPI